MVSRVTKSVRIDEESYNALVKHKTGMTTMSEMIRHSLEAFGYLEKKDDDPFWVQTRLPVKSQKKRK